MKTIGLSVILTGALASPVVACDLCSIYSASMANGGAGRGLFGGIAEQYTSFGTLQDSGHRISNDGEYIHGSTSQLFAGYNFSDRFSLQFNVPIIYRAFGSDAAHGTESGIGDVSLLGNFTALQLMDVDYTFTWT